MAEPEEQTGESRGSRPSDDLYMLLSSKVVGQPAALEFIVPSIQLHQSGLAPEGRPVGVFLLLGPTGTGKTKTVEALAEVLHGDSKRILKIDCGEFQSDHEVAKLIGAPPGYVGHGETQPRLTQQKLQEAASEDCDLALILFDEIEKAAPSVAQLLLGVLDKATLRLGDGSKVDFEKTLIFLTSNLGARDMMREIKPTLGFETSQPRRIPEISARLEKIGLNAVRKQFSPEFVNRIDAVVTYRPLDNTSLVAILDHHIIELQQHVHSRLGHRSFEIQVAPAARYFMLDKGTSMEYGARELRRTIHRNLTQPLAAKVANQEIAPGAEVTVDLNEEGDGLCLKAVGGRVIEPAQSGSILVVDDNEDLLGWMEVVLSRDGNEVQIATTVKAAKESVGRQTPTTAILDYLLPDGDGLTLGVELLKGFPDMQIVIMSGMNLSEEEKLVCQRYGIPVLTKPFVADELLGLIEAGATRGSAARAGKG